MVWFTFLRVPTFPFSVYIFTATQAWAGISIYLTILVIKILSLSLSSEHHHICKGRIHLHPTYISRLNVLCHFFHLVIQKGEVILQFFSQLSAMNKSSVSKLCHLIAPAFYQTICKCGISQPVGLFWKFSFLLRNYIYFYFVFPIFHGVIYPITLSFPIFMSLAVSNEKFSWLPIANVSRLWHLDLSMVSFCFPLSHMYHSR